MQTLNKVIKAAQCEKKFGKANCSYFYATIAQRLIRHNGQTPEFLIFGHNIVTKLPQYTEKPENDQTLRQKDAAAKEIVKQNTESKKEHKLHDFQNGDKVVVQLQNKGKLKIFYDPKLY